MVHVMRSASIAPGKIGEAIAFAREVAKHIKERHGVTLELLMPVGGNPSRISWHASYAGLAEWEALASKILSDGTYMEMVAQHSGTFLPGSVCDEIWRTI